MENLLNKDRVWSRIKKYIYFIVILISLLTVLLLLSVILNCCILIKINQPS